VTALISFWRWSKARYLYRLTVDGARDLMTRGDETTANLIPTGMLLFARATDQRCRMLRSGVRLNRLRAGIDEVLRYELLFPSTRLVREDIDFSATLSSTGEVALALHRCC